MMQCPKHHARHLHVPRHDSSALPCLPHQQKRRGAFAFSHGWTDGIFRAQLQIRQAWQASVLLASSLSRRSTTVLCLPTMTLLADQRSLASGGMIALHDLECPYCKYACITNCLMTQPWLAVKPEVRPCRTCALPPKTIDSDTPGEFLARTK